MTTFTDSSTNGTVRGCLFKHTDGSAIEMFGGEMLVEESYFFGIDWTACDLSSLMTTLRMTGSANVIRRNTMHRLGASATLNPGDGALIELNDISDTGYVQSDGSIVQMMVGQQPGSTTRYNWFHDTYTYTRGLKSVTRPCSAR